MYPDYDSLPPQVKLALDPEDAEQWQSSYNSTRKAGEAHLKAWASAWESIRASGADARWFSGPASVQVEDGHGTVIDINALSECMHEYIGAGGDLTLEHRAGTLGTIYDYEVSDVNGHSAVIVHGVIYRGRPMYDSLWEGMRKNRRGREAHTGLSIGFSTSVGVQWTCGGGSCEPRIIPEELREITITDNPSNPLATASVAIGARSDVMGQNTKDEKGAVAETREGEPAELQEIVAGLADQMATMAGQFSTMDEALRSLSMDVASLREKGGDPDDEEDGKEEKKKDEEEDEESSKEDAPTDQEMRKRIDEMEAQVRSLLKRADTPLPDQARERMLKKYDGSLAQQVFGGR